MVGVTALQVIDRVLFKLGRAGAAVCAQDPGGH